MSSSVDWRAFGELMRARRRDRRATSREAAAATGLPAVTVQRFFAGTPVRLEAALILLAWLGVDNLRDAVQIVPEVLPNQLVLVFDDET